MIRTVAIEDEPNALKSLILGIEKYVPQIELVGHAEDVESAKTLIKKQKPELLLLDIKLKGRDAFQLLDSIDDISFEIIFITAYGEYKERAFDYFALHYLQKPVDFEKLQHILLSHRVRQKKAFTAEKYGYLRSLLNSNFRQLFVPSSNGYEMIHTDDIIWCEAYGSYTKFHLRHSRTLVACKSLKHYQELFKDLNFYRIHRSHLVNLKCLQSVKGNSVILKNKQCLEISKRNKKNFLEVIKALSGN